MANARCLAALLFVGALAAGCDEGVERPDAATRVDAGIGPGVPELTEEPPPVLSWPLATIRGVAPNAMRVVVSGVGNPTFIDVLPDETFCVDVPLPSTGDYTIELVGQSETGLSGPASTQTSFDPSAPEGPVIPTCSGSDPRGCGSEEICDNGVDDDCDSAIDMGDIDCAVCPGDLLEPNDDEAMAPRVPEGTYDGLTQCPDEEDWYAVFLREGETFTLTLTFVDEEGNINARFFDPAGEEVATAFTATDDEMLSHVATETGVYKLRVYQFSSPGVQDYAMDIDISE